MTSIRLILTGAVAKAEVTGVITAGMEGIPVVIECDKQWEGLTKSLVCRSDAGVKTVLDIGTQTTVAPEVLQWMKNASNELFLGVEGRDLDGVIVFPSTMAYCGRIAPGADPGMDNAVKNAEPVWSRVLKTVKELENLEDRWKNDLAVIINEVVKQEQITGGYYTPVVTHTNEGVMQFRFVPSQEEMPVIPDVTVALPEGKEGARGLQGEQGHTPVRGKDYWTEVDKQEINNESHTFIVEELTKRGQLRPEFANSIEECTDTTKLYVLPDGYIYAYMNSQWASTGQAFTSFDTLEDVIDACCDTELISGGNYNLFKISEVTYQSRLTDDTEGTVSSSIYNIVTGWIPVEYGKYYSLSALDEGKRITPGALGTFTRIYAKKKDGAVVIYNKNSDEINSLIIEVSGKYSQQAISIPIEDVVAVRLHLSFANSNDVSTEEKLRAIQPMFVEGTTADEAYENAISFDYVDGDKEIKPVYKYTLKPDKAKADKTDVTKLEDTLIGTQRITEDGAVIGSLFAISLAPDNGRVNTNTTWGIVTDYIPCIVGGTITVDSDKYTFQVMEYLEKDVPAVYSGVLNYGNTYTVTQNGYICISIRYVDTSLTADKSLISHIVANVKSRYDFAKIEEKAYGVSASPFHRIVNFGVMPISYYQGVAPAYEKIFRRGELYADFIAAWKALVANHSGYITETELGSASDDQKIYLYDFKPARITNQNKPIPKIIIIAGQHGFEKSNIYGLYYFVDNLLNRWDKHPALEYLRNHVELMIVPVLNTYGFDNLTYKNGNGVNLNRNYDSNWKLVSDTASEQYGGAKPFDQPETQIVRDLILSNTDASLVVDFHTNGGSTVASYYDVTWYGICESVDSYYNRMLDAVAHHLSAITAHFNTDYELNQPNTMMGHLHNGDGTGLLRNWAVDNHLVGVLVEGFNGFPNETPFIGRVYKANEEIIVNWLITAVNYLGK